MQIFIVHINETPFSSENGVLFVVLNVQIMKYLCEAYDIKRSKS